MLIGDTLKILQETRRIIRDVLGLSEDPSADLTIAMLFQYGKAPFRNLKEGFGEICFMNKEKGIEKVGDLKTMIRNDWNFFQLQREKFSAEGGSAKGGKTVH